jgi:Uma2 family endonuclease
MNSAIAEPPIKNDIKIPDYLIKEEINGKSYAYKGYKSVLSKEKTLEEIMGSSNLQAYLVSCLLEFLFDNLSRKQYKIYTNESGVHLSHKNNLACDIAIFEKEKLFANKITKHYINIPPKVVIEVDVDIESIDHQDVFFMEMGYVSKKTEALLAFGVEKVIWILSEGKKVLVATNDNKWYLLPWNTGIEILDSVTFNIAQFIENEGVEL